MFGENLQRRASEKSYARIAISGIDMNTNSIVPRPHFRLDGDSLFFLDSRRPCLSLSPTEKKAWLALHPHGSSAASTDVAALDRLVSASVCEYVEREFRDARRRVLVVEPHADDAILSVGNTMWLRRHECEFTIATLASRSNFTSYYYLDRDFFSVEKITQLRNAESVLVARMLGGHHIPVGLTDAALRYHDGDWSLEFFRQNRGAISAATGRSSIEFSELSRWKQKIRELLVNTRFDELWLPQGSPHGDHKLAAHACLEVLNDDRGLIENRLVRIYQDVPYAARFPSYSPHVVSIMSSAGYELEAEHVPIEDNLAAKLRLVSVYASQFKIEAMRDDVVASSRAPDSGVQVERFWLVRAMPQQAIFLSNDSNQKRLCQQSAAVARWSGASEGAKRLRVLLLVPSGRWSSDLELLSNRFPFATIDVYAAPAALAEVVNGSASGRRARVHAVGSGILAWALVCLRLALEKPCPTLFASGEKRFREASWLSRLWLLSPKVVVTSLDEVVDTLNG